MKITIHKKEQGTTLLSELKLGDLFLHTLYDTEKLFMKIYPLDGYNVLNIQSGHQYGMNEKVIVKKVEAELIVKEL